MIDCDINSLSVTHRAEKFYEVFIKTLINFCEENFEKTERNLDKEAEGNTTPMSRVDRLSKKL